MANEKNPKVLIVDDDKNICDLLRLYLEKDGYSVLLCHDGDDAVVKFKALSPDMVLLDIMLPGKDGWQVCREIRKISNVPIIMITAKGETIDKVIGLELGADDYIVKPFNILELQARVEGVLRRHGKLDSVIRINGLEINTLSMQVLRGGEELQLTRKEYELLLLFARNPGIVLSKDVIYERIWGGEYPDATRTVELHIQRMKKKAGWEDSLKSVYGMGYRLSRES